MASVPQPQFFSPLKHIKNGASATQKLKPTSLTFAFKFKNLRVSSSLGSSNGESSFRNSSEKPLESDPGEADPVKLAFAKAKAYKKAIQSTNPKIVENPVQETDGIDKKSNELKAGVLKKEIEDVRKEEEVPLSVKRACEKAKEYRMKNEDLTPKIVENPVQEYDGIDKNSDELKAGSSKSENRDKRKEDEVPLSVKLAFEKAKEYRKKKDDILDSSQIVSGSEQTPGLKLGNKENPLKGNGDNKKKELKVSNIDFVGLEFSEKKRSRGLPPGLVPAVDPFAGGHLPEVEILVGDASKFGDGAAVSEPMPTEEEDSDVYKPKVSTWGVFPRPSNISKTYGGGRNMRPGEALETAEDRAAKEARTRQLLAAYKSKIGLNHDPKLKSECEKALKDGNSLMDLGKLKEAIPLYQKVMDKLAFQTELYGLAALQWSICQDSLTRPNEARAMYEKLQSHPNPQVSKKARQLMFGFQAMEMMKVSSSSLSPTNTGYQDYFEAFVKDKTNYTLEEAEVDEGSQRQALIYMLFLLCPILFVILAAVEKRL